MIKEQRRFRLLLDEAVDGVRNMAVDEAMLAGVHCEGATPVLRWYQWTEPTLSLGYFQRWNEVPAELTKLPRVRRSTGGGAIVHASELTYSLAFPTGSWPRKSALEMVDDVHAAVGEAIRVFSPEMKFSTPPAVWNAPITSEPFLCFKRRGPHDLVSGADKIMGSAQRRQGGRLLQHGSIPLRGWNADELSKRITGLIANRWRTRFDPSELTADEKRLAIEFEVKHQSLEWTQRR